jgi:hypothetical protein
VRDGAAAIFVARRTKHQHGIGFIAGGAERGHRRTVAAQHSLRDTVGVNNGRGHFVALLGARGDRFADGLGRERRREAMRRQHALRKCR